MITQRTEKTVLVVLLIAKVALFSQRREILGFDLPTPLLTIPHPSPFRLQTIRPRTFISLVQNDYRRGDSKKTSENSDENDEVSPDLIVKRKKSAESTFWYVREAKENVSSGEDKAVPCDPFLGTEGPLPLGAYRIIKTPSTSFASSPDSLHNQNDDEDDSDALRACLLTVALDLSNTSGRKLGRNDIDRAGKIVDPSFVVKGMQAYIDRGFTSFQLADCNMENEKDVPPSVLLGGSAIESWGESKVFGMLKRETPQSVLSRCLLTVKLGVPASGIGMVTSIRSAISDKLLRLGADYLDQVQVRCVDNSPYLMDELDTLFDLQREGLIRSISGKDISNASLDNASQCGFALDSNEVICNVLDRRSSVLKLRGEVDFHGLPPTFVEDKHRRAKLCASSPLMGGLLTDEFVKRKHEPYAMELTTSQRRHIRNIRSWAKYANTENGEKSFWPYFHGNVLSTLGDVAWKHQVSTSSVAIRWALQQPQNLRSVVVSTRRFGSRGAGADSAGRVNRIKELREVFTFALDENDILALEKAAGYGKLPGRPPKSPASPFVDTYSDRRLWL